MSGDPTDARERYEPGKVGDHYEHPHRYLLARSFARGARVVDLASGEGYGSAALARDAASVLGVEIDADAVHEARRRYARSSTLAYVRGDITRAPVRSGSADLVVCFEAIEHVGEPKEVVAEAARIVHERGLVLLSTPDKAVHTDELGYENPFHPSELYRQELEDLLHAHFDGVGLLAQRTLSGSCIWPLDGSPAPAQLRVGGSLDASQDCTDRLAGVYLVALCSHDPEHRAFDAVRRFDVFSDGTQRLLPADLVEAELARLKHVVGDAAGAVRHEGARAARASREVLELRASTTRLLRELVQQQDAIARLQDRPPSPAPKPAPEPPAGRVRRLVERARCAGRALRRPRDEATDA